MGGSVLWSGHFRNGQESCAMFASSTKNPRGIITILDIQSLVAKLSRPRLLVRAARFGLDDYNRERTLPRLLQCETVPRPGDSVMQLMGVEAELNDQRIAKSATYAIADHIEVLTAIMGEAQILQATTRPTLKIVT